MGGIVLLLGIVASAVVVVIAHRTSNRFRFGECASKLRSLWQCQYIYMNQFGGPGKLMPAATGREFWLTLARTPIPLISTPEVFFCPVAANEIVHDATDFLGPASNANRYGDRDSVIADGKDNHGHGRGGVLLLMDGSIHTCDEGNPFWIDADAKLSP